MKVNLIMENPINHQPESQFDKTSQEENLNGSHENEISEQEFINEDSARFSNLTLEDKIRYFGLPFIGFIVMCFIWLELYKPVVIDEWNKGKFLIDKASAIPDPVAALEQINQGGAILKEQLNKHPYHARLWHLYGHYFLVKEQWDSCIYMEKKAIELGAGGVVNHVEFIAADNLNLALQMKLNQTRNLDSSLQIIKFATIPTFENYVIDKFKGLVYSKFKQPDSCIANLKIYLKHVPDDEDALYKLSENYMRKGDKQNALLYANEAKQFLDKTPLMDTLLKNINAL